MAVITQTDHILLESWQFYHRSWIKNEGRHNSVFFNAMRNAHLHKLLRHQYCILYCPWITVDPRMMQTKPRLSVGMNMGWHFAATDNYVHTTQYQCFTWRYSCFLIGDLHSPIESTQQNETSQHFCRNWMSLLYSSTKLLFGALCLRCYNMEKSTFPTSSKHHTVC